MAPDHRPVTVMFVNYRGISDLIQELGESQPEIITNQLHRYFCHMADIVEKYEGTLARMDQYAVGDRLVIFFGAPRAHEDDPVRAVYTALEMQADTRKHFAALQTEAGIYRFDQRIGINTGHLFAGNVGAANLRQEYTLMGDDINMAARLMSKAEWGDIFVSKKTQERVAPLVELESKGELKVKGKEVPIPTFKVLGRREAAGRTRGLDSGESPLTGRDRELQALQSHGQALLAGRGQIVAVIGDSGLGKSRLKRELNNWIFNARPAGEVNWFEGQSLSFSEQVSHWLINQILYSALGLKADANKDDMLFTLWKRGESLLGKETAREAIPFLAHLLKLPLEGVWAKWVAELEPNVRQKQTFWAMRQFFTAVAEQKPTIIALEDLHWADEASLALIEDLFTVTDHAPLMFYLILRRQRDKGSWRLRDKAESAFPHRYTEIGLAPLSKANSRRLLGRLLPGAKFSDETVEEILNKVAGNPFYLEEVVRSLMESSAVVPDPDNPGQWQVTHRIDEIAVPDSLQGAIVARLDRLPEDVRQGLQMAAVIGRRFQARLLRGLATESELERWLAELERVGLIRLSEVDRATSRRGAKIADLLNVLIGDNAPKKAEEQEQVYTFPDALVQEVAYESLLAQRRQQFHRQVGEALEQLFAGRLDEECEMLAYHFGRSDDQAKAMHYLEKASQVAQAEFANETAVQHSSELLERLGDDDGHWQRRFDVLKRRQQVYGLLGRQLEREADLQTMLQLAEAHQDEARRADALNGLADFYQWTGRYDDAVQTAQEALALKEAQADKAGQAAALHQIGVVHYYRGNYPQAQPALSQAAALRREVEDPAGESWSELYLCMINFVAGNYGTAQHHNDLALQAAESRQDWLQMGIHLNNGARIAHRLGEYEQALAHFEQALEYRRRVGDRTGQGFTLYGVGLVRFCLGQLDEAEAALQKSLEIRQAINDERGAGYCTYGLGLVATGRGQLAEAEGHFRRAAETFERLGLRGELVTALSFLGQVYLAQGQPDEGCRFSQQAIDLLAGQQNVEEVQQIYFNHYRVLQALGDPAAAGALAQARQAMQQQAEAIADPEKRQTFLEKVKVNREIAAAA
ncbi:MAG: tetratricopeptide repeat protein [Chloroflexi bacterium]|nr:tetratricopeptide repeat protein [Chloroflexota bacterium]MCI0575748.1 tetratricopeptide repeat protein [Chloroflexota bacterium]MCI0643645.1 tetratricopeptide repeat protein [Chloroflexota bacterium]MCI0729814.1 tetratricopeptide repeat protein [Chloroflexota bacterium]